MDTISNSKIKDTTDIGDNKFRYIFEQSPIAIEFYDATGKLVEANQACLDLLGVKNTEVIKGSDLFDKPNLPKQAIIDVKDGKSVIFEFEFDFDRVKGEKLYDTSRLGICYLECFIHPIKNENGTPIGYIANTTEITVRKQNEISLEKRAKELQKINDTKDKLFSTIAHDLKSPFNAILGFSDLMLNNFHSLEDKTLHKGLTTIKSASTHGHQLLENLLIWARNQSGRNTFNPEVLSIRAQIDQALKLTEGFAIKKDIHISVNCRKKYPVYADKYMIGIVLTNLISNAIKYSYNGGKVKVTASENNDFVEISVSDFGTGIHQNILESLFEIDKRKNTLGTADEQGTGMGLIICKDFLEKHDSHFKVESFPGEGSKFTFSLPIYAISKPVLFTKSTSGELSEL